MSEEKKEIKLKEGESKEIEINIPLVVDGGEEVIPKENSIRDENQNRQGKKNQKPEGEQEEVDQTGVPGGDQGGEGEQKPEGDGQKEQGDQGSEQGKEGEDKKKEGSSPLTDVGKMNQRPERRHYPQAEKLGSTDNTKPNNDFQRLGTRGQMNQRPEQRPEKKKTSLADKMVEGTGKIGDKHLPNARIPEKKRKGESELDSDYEPGATKKQDLMSSWNKLRGSVRNKKKNDSKESRSATGQIVSKGSRLASFEFYRLCWLNLIDSFGLTYFGLLFLFIAKYVAHSDKIAKFVTIKDESVRLKIIEHKETTSIGMMLIFIAISFAIVALIFLVIILIILFLWAMGAIEIEGLSRLEFFMDIIKSLF